MTNEELKELEIIVEKFDNIDINNLNSLRDLKYSKIPSEKLLKLVELAKQNNKRALTILVKYYYPFILSIVFNYNIEGIDLNDVAMAAVNGFIEGIKKFKSGNINNSVYFYIIKNINKEISLNHTTAKVGDNFDYIVFLYLKYLNDLEAGNTKELDCLELASKFNIDMKGMRRIIGLVNRKNYVDTKITTEDVKIGDDDYYETQDILTIINKYIPLNYQKIFKMYYGLGIEEPLTKKQIAKIVNITDVGVEHILENCLFILKSTSALNSLTEYYYKDYIKPHYYLSKRSISQLKAPIKRLIYLKKINGSITK